MTRLRSVLLLTAAALSVCCEGLSQGLSARQIAHAAFPSVALLVTQDIHGQPLALGSGFFVRPNVMVTNLHVIDGAAGGWAKIVGQANKYQIEGTVGLDEARDLLLLRVKGAEAAPLKLGDSSQVAPGDAVLVVDNPRGFEGTLSEGIVSAIRSVDSDILLQITAPISPGSSGGPVLDREGRVVGVTVATLKGGQNLNFAVPVSYLSKLLASVEPLAPLAPAHRRAEENSIVGRFGRGVTEGVVATQFAWDSDFFSTGNFTFTIRNELSQAIKDIRCVVIFYDEEKNPVDFVEGHYYTGTAVIPPGFGTRVGDEVIYSESVRNLLCIATQITFFGRESNSEYWISKLRRISVQNNSNGVVTHGLAYGRNG